MHAAQLRYIRKVEPLATDWRGCAWNGGRFDTAQRAYTPTVTGEIHVPHHLLLVTLRGGAERLEVDSDCGHRYRGSDRGGSVSFVPAHCARRMTLHGVQSRWASLALRPEVVDTIACDGAGRTLELGAFTNADDPLLAGMLSEFERVHALDGGLDPAWCDAMSLAIAHCLLRRHGYRVDFPNRARRLPAWRLRKLAEYVDARLEDEIRVADLAVVAGMSVGHLHRSLRATSGSTPLRFIHARRIRRAMHLLATGERSVTEVAVSVGFTSVSHFARVFRQHAGMPPSVFRKR
jgi:AraC family transcriptional regulator